MGTWDLPDIYAHTLGLGHIYQTNPWCPCYNYYIYVLHKCLRGVQKSVYLHAQCFKCTLLSMAVLNKKSGN